MLNTTTTIQRPTVKAAPAPLYDVSAIIGFSGEIIGSVVVSFPKATAIKAVLDLIDPGSTELSGSYGYMDLSRLGFETENQIDLESDWDRIGVHTRRLIEMIRRVPGYSIEKESK